MKNRVAKRRMPQHDKHRRERKSLLCISRSGAYFQLFVGVEGLYLMRTGGKRRGSYTRRPALSEAEAKEFCGQHKSDRVIYSSDIRLLKYRERDRWIWYGPVHGLLTIQTSKDKLAFGVLGDAELQDIGNALNNFPHADIDDGTKKQRLLELEREAESRRDSRTYKRIFRIFTATWVVGIALAVVYFSGGESLACIVVIPVVIYPSIVLFEYLLFADYMDMDYAWYTRPREMRINPVLPFSVLVLAIVVSIRGVALLSWKNVMLLSAAVIAVWIFFLIRYSPDFKRHKIQATLLFLIFLMIYIPFAFIALNVFMDTSVISQHHAEVLSKYSSRYGAPHVRVRLPDGNEETFNASLGYYRKVEPGDLVTVYQQSGALNISYLYIAESAPIRH